MLQEIKDSLQEGRSGQLSLKFEDCGSSHTATRFSLTRPPLIKRLSGKEQYQISLRWETIEETLEKIKQFAVEVESITRQLGR